MRRTSVKLGYLLGSYVMIVLTLIMSDRFQLHGLVAPHVGDVIQRIVPLLVTVGFICATKQKILVRADKSMLRIEALLGILILALFINDFKSINLVLQVLSILLGVIFEELYFRGYLLPQLMKLVQIKDASHAGMGGILIASVIFGLTHLVNLSFQTPLMTAIQIVTAVLLGIILSLLYMRTRIIVIPIIIHLALDLSVLTATGTVVVHHVGMSDLTQVVIYGGLIVILARAMSRTTLDTFTKAVG